MFLLHWGSEEREYKEQSLNEDVPRVVADVFVFFHLYLLLEFGEEAKKTNIICSTCRKFGIFIVTAAGKISSPRLIHKAFILYLTYGGQFNPS